MTRVKASGHALHCSEEQYTLTFTEVDDTLHASLTMNCKVKGVRKYLHEFMHRVYAKELVSEAWLQITEIDLGFELSNRTTEGGRVPADNSRKIPEKASFTGRLHSLDHCPGNSGTPTSFCSLLKGRLPDDMVIRGDISDATFELNVQGATGPMTINLKAEPLLSSNVEVTSAVMKLYYGEDKFCFHINCHVIENKRNINARGRMESLGHGIPVMNFWTQIEASNFMDSPYVKVPKGSRGHVFLDPTKPFQFVFDEKVTVGSSNVEGRWKQLTANFTLTFGDGIRPRLLAREDQNDKLTTVISWFGTTHYHPALEPIHFLTGYTLMYCGDGQGDCALPGFKTRNTKLQIKGRIFMFGIIIDVRLYVYENMPRVTKIEGVSEMITSDNKRLTLESSAQDGSGPRFEVTSVDTSGGDGYVKLIGYVEVEGIGCDGEFKMEKMESSNEYYLLITCNAKWHGETDLFTFSIRMFPNPTFMKVRYEVDATLVQDKTIDKNSLLDTLQHYIDVAEENLEQAQLSNDDTQSHESTIGNVLDKLNASLLALGDKLEDMTLVLVTLQPRLNADCVAKCGNRESITITESAQCSDTMHEDILMPCLNRGQRVVDYPCVAECEADKIISRDEINHNWKTAAVMVPEYERLARLLFFALHDVRGMKHLFKDIQKYSNGIKECTEHILLQMKSFQETYEHEDIKYVRFRSLLFTSRVRGHDKHSCYEFELTTNQDGINTSTHFTACFGGVFQQRVDREILKHLGMDVETLEKCLKTTSQSYASAFQRTEALAVKVEHMVKRDNRKGDNDDNQKRTSIIGDDEQKRLEKYRKAFRLSAGNVVTRGESTRAAFAKSVPWVLSNNFQLMKEWGHKAGRKVFNSSFSPEKQISCPVARNAVDTYKKLSRNLYSMTKNYVTGKRSYTTLKRSLDTRLDKLEISLFQKYSKTNPGIDNVRDMAYWLMESRKGHMMWMEDISKGLDHQNRHSITYMKDQVQNFVNKIDSKMSAENFLSTLSGAVETTEKRSSLQAASTKTHFRTQDLVTMFRQDGVTLEDAQDAIADMWEHSQQLSHVC